MKYVFLFAVFVSILAGAFYSGITVGKSKAKTEYITKEVEVIKYVEKKKAEIYNRPNAGRDDIIRMFNAGDL